MNRRGIPAAAGSQFVSTDDDDYSSEAAACVDATDNFSNMPLCDFDLPDDLFELMWQGGGDVGAGLEQPLAVSRLRLSPPPPSSHDHHRHDVAPSEEEMAAWFYPIVSDDFTTGQLQRPNANDGQRTLPVELGTTRSEITNESISGESDVQNAASDDSGERKKQQSSSSAGGSTRKSHHSAGAHNLTEKRRRFKITESLKTLQQLVPGCDKLCKFSESECHVITDTAGMRPSIPVRPGVDAGPDNPVHEVAAAPGHGDVRRRLRHGGPAAVHTPYTQPTVPFAAMLPCPQYYSAVMLPTASLYQPAAATAPGLAPAAAGGSHRRHGWSTGGRSKNSSSLRCKKL
ncbi:hypothetical protein ABZP36_010606 [Zizania latifolia]